MKLETHIISIFLKRIAITIGIVLFIRIGTFLPVPGIDQTAVAFYLENHPYTRNVVSTFSGNDGFVIGLFTLNIFPYINATIITQLLVGSVPKLSKLQKEGDLTGRRLINRLTRLLTFILATIQSTALAFYLKQPLFDWSYSLAFETILWLTTGAMIVLWLSEIITDYGLGNGSSILVYINIISNLPNLGERILREDVQTLSLSSELQISLITLLSLYAIVFLQEGVIELQLTSSKQLNQKSLKDSVRMYIPFRFNQAGVMPIILSTAVLLIPNYIIQNYIVYFGGFPLIIHGIFTSGIFGFVYWIGYFRLVIVFSEYYGRLVLNPKDIAEQMQKTAVAFSEVRPGSQTRFFLKKILTRVTFTGAVGLAILVTVPNYLESTFSITNISGLGTTSLLILAGVLLDLGREIETIYYSNIYNNKY